MRNVAPSSTAFMRTSKSSGKVMPKKSASVKTSRARPDHCFDIFPTFAPVSETICIENIIINKSFSYQVSSTCIELDVAAERERAEWTLNAKHRIAKVI